MTNQTQAVQKSAKRDIRSLLQSDNVKQQIALALPKHLTADRMTRVALTTINRTPKLLNCTPESLLSGLMLCSQVGLEPDGRNAHLIPYGDQCQVIFDWKGLVALARRNGVKNIAADVVCDNDEFEWYRTGDGLQFRHKVDWKKPRGQVYAAYCIWKDGDQFDGDVMTKEDVEGIRKRSRAGQNGPWVTDWNEMAKKTVVRRSSKKWPLDPESAAAFNADDDTLEAKPVVSRPVFDKPKALFEVAQEQPEAQNGDDDGDLGPTAASASTAEAEAPKQQAPGKSVQNLPKAIRGLLKLSGHTEVELLDLLRSTGQADESLSGLEEIAMVAEPTLRKIHDTWQQYSAQLAELKGKAAK